MVHHVTLDQQPIDLPLGKVVCVGRNYAEHARELNNAVPTAPMLFIKPSTALCALTEPLVIPTDRGSVHHELELTLLIGKPLRRVSAEEVDAAIWGFGLGLDLTLREVQSQLKGQGHPWEVAKGFDGAAPLSPFTPGVAAWQDLCFSLDLDGERRQTGHTGDMIFGVRELVAFMSQHFTLLPGDVIMTGTPAGVGPLRAHATVRCALEGVGVWETVVG